MTEHGGMITTGGLVPPGHYMQSGKRLYQMNRVPGWLASDIMWQDHLQALTGDDIDLFEAQWKLAGGSEHWDVDTSWIAFEDVGVDMPRLWPWLLFAFVGIPGLVLLLGFGITAVAG